MSSIRFAINLGIWNQGNNLENQILNWIVIRSFQFLGFVPLLSWISVSYFVLFGDLLSRSLKKKKGYYIRRERQWSIHKSRREKVFMVIGFLSWLFNWYNVGWFFVFYRLIFSLPFFNSPQTIRRLPLNSYFGFGFGSSWVEPWKQADIEDVHETKCKKEFETQAVWQSFEICCPSKEIHYKSLF